MLSLKRHFRGDTLIEVTIAIGIFALVAISVVAVVSISTSGAQSALENTLAREEVDAQAGTIRFIQNTIDPDIDYENLPDTSKEKLYYALWSRLKLLAEANKKIDGTINDDVISFSPDTCSAVYNDTDDTDDSRPIDDQNAFIIDLKKLNSYKEGDNVNDFAEEVILSASEQNKLFTSATTYPQIAYSDGSNESLLTGGLRSSTIKSVEGIYVVGVPDISSTNYVYKDETTGDEAVGTLETPSYYDFYVRSCWYNSGSENSSAVSTAVRVRDPEAIAYIEPPEQTIPKDDPPDFTFDNIEWKTYGDNDYKGYLSRCGASGPVLSQPYSSQPNVFVASCEPSAGQHVTLNGTSITLIGSTADPVNLGAYYDKFSTNVPFILQVNIDAANVGSHPVSSNGDGLTIKMDIVDADGNIVISGISANIITDNQSITIPGTEEKIITTSTSYNLLLEYNRGMFKACVTQAGDAQQCISATKPIPADSYLKVDYNLKHSRHGCDYIAVIKLSNITMSRNGTGTITF